MTLAVAGRAGSVEVHNDRAVLASRTDSEDGRRAEVVHYWNVDGGDAHH